MKSKISFFNKGILLNDLKRFLWLGIAYFVFLFFSIPVKILNICDYNKIQINNPRYMYNIFSFDSSPLTFSIYIVPVLIALILFRYIQNKKSIDTIHSLPITREQLFNSHVFFGLMTVIIPVILISIICFLLKISLNLNDKNLHFTYNTLIYWAGITILLTTFIFLFTTLVGMLTGLTTTQGILTYILLFLPAGLSVLASYNLNISLYGFPCDYLLANAMFLSPITRLTDLNRVPMDNYEIIVYVTLSCVAFIIGRLLYKKRKSEAISNVVAFELLQPVFKYGVTFCCMLVGGMYFAYIEKSLYWIIFGYILTSFIGYIVSEMIIKKSLRVFKNLKGYCFYSVVITLIIICINFDLIGYETKLPTLNEVESIFFGRNFYSLSKDNVQDPPFYKESSSIEKIQRFHKDIIDSKINNPKASKGNYVALAYKLKNGRTIKRQYSVSNEVYHKNFKDIYESNEYKILQYPILSIDPNSIDKIFMHPDYASFNELTITNPLEIKEFINILKDELINQHYDNSSKLSCANIEILYSNNNEKIDDYRNKYMNCNFEQSYAKLEKWLIEKGYVKSARIMSEDIDHIIIEKFDGLNKNINIDNKNVKRLEIKDKTQIDTCLKNTYTDDRGEYIIGFYAKNNHVFYGTLKKDNLPTLVKDFFK